MIDIEYGEERVPEEFARYVFKTHAPHVESRPTGLRGLSNAHGNTIVNLLLLLLLLVLALVAEKWHAVEDLGRVVGVRNGHGRADRCIGCSAGCGSGGAGVMMWRGSETRHLSVCELFLIMRGIGSDGWGRKA